MAGTGAVGVQLCCGHLATALAPHKLAGNASRSRIARLNDLGASNRRAWKVPTGTTAPLRHGKLLVARARRCSRRANLTVSATDRDATDASRTARCGCVEPEMLCPRLSRHSRNDSHHQAPRPQPSLQPPGSFRDADLPRRVHVCARCLEMRAATRAGRPGGHAISRAHARVTPCVTHCPVKLYCNHECDGPCEMVGSGGCPDCPSVSDGFAGQE